MQAGATKKEKGHGKVTFKTYAPNQLFLLPPSTDDLIGPSHIVRLVSEAIDGIDLSNLLSDYDWRRSE